MMVMGSSSWFMPGSYHEVSRNAIPVYGEDLDVSAPHFAPLLKETVVPLLVEKLIDKLRAVFQLDVDALTFIGGIVRGSHHGGYM